MANSKVLLVVVLASLMVLDFVEPANNNNNNYPLLIFGVNGNDETGFEYPNGFPASALSSRTQPEASKSGAQKNGSGSNGSGLLVYKNT